MKVKQCLLFLISLSFAAMSFSDEVDHFWQGLTKEEIELKYPLLTIRGEKGFLSCAYIDVDTCDRTGEACATVSGVKNHQDMLEAEIRSVSSLGKELGIKVGMKGREALRYLR